MSEYTLTQVFPSDKRTLAQVDRLLVEDGITRDANLDYICAMEDEKVAVAKQIANEVTGGLSKPNTGVMFCLPLLSHEGLK